MYELKAGQVIKSVSARTDQELSEELGKLPKPLTVLALVPKGTRLCCYYIGEAQKKPVPSPKPI